MLGSQSWPPKESPAMPRNDARYLNEERLLVVSPWGLSGGYSGPIMLLNRLFGELHRRHGVRIDVLYRNRGDETVPAWVNRAYAVDIGSRQRFGRRAQLAWAIRAAAFLARHASGYRCVHLHGAYWVSLFPALFDRCANLSVLPVLEAGDLASGRLPRSSAQRFLRQRAAAKTISLFYLSAGIAREAHAAGWQCDRLVPIANPVDGSFHLVARKAPTETAVRLGFAGKLGPTKRPDRVLAAVAKLVNEGIDASAVFVGPYATAEYETYFKRQVASLGLQSRAKVTGFTDDVASYMKHSMDMFVLPSMAEGMPGALAEAMACGLPFIVTDVGEMGNVSASSGAGVIVDGSAESIVAATKRLLAESHVYKRMSENAAAHAARYFSPAAVADRFFDNMLAVPGKMKDCKRHSATRALSAHD